MTDDHHAAFPATGDTSKHTDGPTTHEGEALAKKMKDDTLAVREATLKLQKDQASAFAVEGQTSPNVVKP